MAQHPTYFIRRKSIKLFSADFWDIIFFDPSKVALPVLSSQKYMQETIRNPLVMRACIFGRVS